MKVTKQQLKQIIKEEIARTLDEQLDTPEAKEAISKAVMDLNYVMAKGEGEGGYGEGLLANVYNVDLNVFLQEDPKPEQWTLKEEPSIMGVGATDASTLGAIISRWGVPRGEAQNLEEAVRDPTAKVWINRLVKTLSDGKDELYNGVKFNKLPSDYQQAQEYVEKKIYRPIRAAYFNVILYLRNQGYITKEVFTSGAKTSHMG